MIGALLGTQDGRTIEIFNSFELQFDLFDDGQLVINMEYYKTKEEQCEFDISWRHFPGEQGVGGWEQEVRDRGQGAGGREQWAWGRWNEVTGRAFPHYAATPW